MLAAAVHDATTANLSSSGPQHSSSNTVSLACQRHPSSSDAPTPRIAGQLAPGSGASVALHSTAEMPMKQLGASNESDQDYSASISGCTLHVEAFSSQV